MKFSSTRQEEKTSTMKLVFYRMNLDNIRVEEFAGEIYLHGDHAIYGRVTAVVKARGAREFIDLPNELKNWKNAI